MPPPPPPCPERQTGHPRLISLKSTQSFEHVLANINKLNRSLEAVIAVGHEFSSVEALWSQFEGVMAKEPEQPPAAAAGEGDGEGDQTKNEEGEEGDTTTTEHDRHHDVKEERRD